MNQFVFSIQIIWYTGIVELPTWFRTSDYRNRTFNKRSKKDLVRDEPALLRTSLFGEHRFVLKRFSPLKGNNWPSIPIKLIYHFSWLYRISWALNWCKLARIQKDITWNFEIQRFKIIENVDKKMDTFWDFAPVE